MVLSATIEVLGIRRIPIRTIWTIAFLFLFTPYTYAANDPAPDWQYVEKRLVKGGLGPKFIQSLKKRYEPKSFTRTLELNLLLFLRKFDDHGVQVSSSASDTVRRFMARENAAIARVQREHKVRGSVIASLLWIESRHGVNKGEFHVPSVYLHMLQAERPAVIEHLNVAAHKFTKNVTPKARTEIKKRTKRKADWALSELKAIEKMQRTNKKAVELRGSFAGAFGMPQFIPSSYVRWARSASKARPPNLNLVDDAILSVGYYLKENGWRPQKPKAQMKALLHYNNSKDYANAILKLAAKVDKHAAQELKRVPAKKEK